MAVVTPAAPAATEEDKELLISGSEAVAEALTLADLDVVTAYPIRPYDTVMQAIAKKISGGQLVAEYIVAEGEHSQFEIVKHASTVGARVFCGSSGVGWMYAMECLVVTPPLRVPMVALVGNRALDDPGAFGVEHNDALVVRDVGWLLCWIDTSQEALDTTLIAYRVAEDRRVFLPLAISADGAFLTHSQALTMVPPKSKVDRFLPRYDRGDLLLHPDNPITVAPQANEDWVIEIRRQNNEAMARAVTVIEEAYADFRRVFGRGPENPWFEEYMTDDADIILVGMGTISLPIKVAIREHPRQGQEGRPGAAALVPTVPDREARRRAVQGEGARHHRPRLLVRLAVRLGGGRQRDPRGTVQCRAEAAAPVASSAGWAAARSRSRTSTRRRTCATRPRRPGSPTPRPTGWACGNRRSHHGRDDDVHATPRRSSSRSAASSGSRSRNTSPPGTGPARAASPRWS